MTKNLIDEEHMEKIRSAWYKLLELEDCINGGADTIHFFFNFRKCEVTMLLIFVGFALSGVVFF